MNILENRLNFNKICSFYRLISKSQTVKLLYTDDNYLHIHSNKDLYRYRNFSAYLKLLFAIRNNQMRRIILKSYFRKFAETIDGFIPFKTLNLKKCLIHKIINLDNYPRLFLNRTVQLWRQITVLTRPNIVIITNIIVNCR